jgi:uncharacterized protein (DUF1778 family)
MARKKQLSGGARLKLAGRHPVLLGLEPHEHAEIKAAADADGRSVSKFFIRAAIAAARKQLAKSS